ncbi:MAG: hypothetical protein RIK87_13460, partial [Fuerstiella sp.]
KKAAVSKQMYTYSLPVHFTLQWSFPEERILDPESDDPDISGAAIEELEAELTDLLRQHYSADNVSVLDDALGSLFLGRHTE